MLCYVFVRSIPMQTFLSTTVSIFNFMHYFPFHIIATKLFLFFFIPVLHSGVTYYTHK